MWRKQDEKNGISKYVENGAGTWLYKHFFILWPLCYEASIVKLYVCVCVCAEVEVGRGYKERKPD